MNAFTKSSIAALALAAALTFGPVTEASAHEVRHRPYTPYYGHIRPIRRHVPHWVRENRDFYRWYRRNHFRFANRMGWHRLFELYRYDVRHHRHGRYGHSYIDRWGRRIYISY